MALVTRFCTTCCKRTLSPQTGRKQSVSARRVTPFWAASLWQAAQTAAVASFRATRSSLSSTCFCSSLAARKRSSVRLRTKATRCCRAGSRAGRASGASARVSSPLLTANSGLRRS